MAHDFKISSGLDVGSVTDTTIPTGALLLRGGSVFSTTSIDILGICPCDGRALSRTTYKALFDVIGTAWGTGDGSTTFNVPSLHSTLQFLSGANANANLNTTTGSSSHTHTVTTTPTAVTSGASMPHNHAYSGNLDSVDNSHSHNQFNTGSWYANNSNAPTQTQYKTDGTQVAAAINHVHSGYVPDAASGNAVAGYSYAHGHTMSGSLTSSSGDTHSHDVSFSSGTSSSATAYPPYVTALYYIKL